MVALYKALAKSAGIGLSITAVYKNAGKKTLGQDDFFVVTVCHLLWLATNTEVPNSTQVSGMEN